MEGDEGGRGDGGRVLTEPDKRDEEPNAGTNGQNERLGHDAGEPLSETEQGEDEENPARGWHEWIRLCNGGKTDHNDVPFHEYGSHCFSIRDRTTPMEADD